MVGGVGDLLGLGAGANAKKDEIPPVPLAFGTGDATLLPLLPPLPQTQLQQLQLAPRAPGSLVAQATAAEQVVPPNRWSSAWRRSPPAG